MHEFIPLLLESFKPIIISGTLVNQSVFRNIIQMGNLL